MISIVNRAPPYVKQKICQDVCIQFPAGAQSTVSLRGVQRRSNLLWSTVGDCFPRIKSGVAMTCPRGLWPHVSE